MTEQEIVLGGLEEPAGLEPEQGSLALASPEDHYSQAAWEKAAAAVLRKARRLTDADPDDQVWVGLTRTTLDGVAIPPLGVPDQLEGLHTAGRPTRAGDWDIRAHLAVGDAKVANEAALDDLDNGATSLWLEIHDPSGLTTMLDGVLLDLAPVVLEAGHDPVGTARAFLAHAAGTTLPAATNLGIEAAAATAEIADLAREAGVLGFVVDATEVHDRGASEVQELAHSMRVAATYLRTLTDEGVNLDEAVGLVEFRYAATDEQLVTIAKLRAARRLWARVLQLSDAGPVEQRQHVVTSRPMMSKYDPWVNMLRTTVAAFAAGVGGADAVTVLPFDSPLGVSDEFGRRIARNTSSLLISESHVAQVADPAGGAYAVEKLTDDLAVAAWELFGRLEAGDSLDELVAATVAAREAQVATRRRPITGLTEFPHLGEVLPEREPDPRSDARPGLRRWGSSFETLRDDPPAGRAFLATMGSVAAHTARATFASNLLAAGGIAIDVAGPTGGAADLVAAYDKQPVVCLAGSDAAYSEWGAGAVAALRAAGARWVIVAGPADMKLARDYADDSCAMGVDALAFLHRTREKLK